MYITVWAVVVLDGGGKQWLQRSLQCPAQMAPYESLELAGVTLRITDRRTDKRDGALRLLTAPLAGDRFVPCLTENLFVPCDPPSADES